jgi:hypothetical protein
VLGSPQGYLSIGLATIFKATFEQISASGSLKRSATAFSVARIQGHQSNKMSQPTQFTAEEEKNFKEWDFQRRRGEQLLWYNSGIPMTSRQEEWLKEKERRDRAARPEYARPSPQQPAWGAHQSYSSYSPPSFVATSESFEEYPASNPPEGPESPRGSLGPNGDYSPPDEPNPQAQKRTAGLEMTRVCPSCYSFGKFASR